MLPILKKIFSKNPDREDQQTHLPFNETVQFILKFDKIVIGTLNAVKGKWIFKYSDEFKKLTEKYNPIIGFPDLDKTYESEELWPFFLIRIPGLNQPAVQEILEVEEIDKQNEVALLKRFGYKSISNPYKLIPV